MEVGSGSRPVDGLENRRPKGYAGSSPVPSATHVQLPSPALEMLWGVSPYQIESLYCDVRVSLILTRLWLRASVWRTSYSLPPFGSVAF